MTTATLDKAAEVAETGLTLDDFLDEDLDVEALEAADLGAIEKVQHGYLGFRVRLKKAPQTRKWPEHLKEAALAAVGGGETDAVNISDRLFPKQVDCVKQMGKACGELERMRHDRWYTLPHPEPGLRLVRKGREEELIRRLKACESGILTAAQRMNDERDLIKAAAQRKLKDRYVATFYDVDFSQLFRVEISFPSVEVPTYLENNQKLYDQEMRRVRVEAAKVVLAEKRQAAEALLEVVDSLVFRLEGKRMLDGSHEVLDVVAAPEGTYTVNYRERGAEPKQVTLSKADYDKRVTEAAGRKVFKNNTASALFQEIALAENRLKETGIGGGELDAVFGKLSAVVRNFSDGADLAKQLRQSDGLRNAMRTNLTKVGNAVLDLAVVKGRRSIIRNRANAAAFNPSKV